MSTSKNYSLYRVTDSTVDAMPVGSLMVDKGVLLTRIWDVINFKTGQSTGAVGKRVGRLCRECRVTHKRATDINHAGECGPDVAPIQPDDEVTS